MASTTHTPADPGVHAGDLLERIAHSIDASGVGHHDHTAVYVELHDDEVLLGLRGFARHPTEELAGFVAPPTWWAFVLCTSGRAHFLDEPDRPPAPTLSTFGRARDGSEVHLLRRGSEVARMHGRAEGRIPDLVRHILPRWPSEGIGTSP